MYSRASDRPSDGIRIPQNYSGSIFRQQRNPPTAAMRADEENEPSYAETAEQEPFAPPYGKEQNTETVDARAPNVLAEADTSRGEAEASLLSPLGSLGTEELLLIALALIIFQSGKEPQLALILLALLFIN